MKKILLAACAALLMVTACEEQEIPMFKTEDSMVIFTVTSLEFSLKGVTDPVSTLKVPVSLIGVVCDYDREINVEVVDSSYNSASQGVDFVIKEAIIPAGEMSGSIVLEVKGLTDDNPVKVTTLAIRPNEYFTRIITSNSIQKTSWSKDYARPSNEHAWKAWYYFFGPCYSKAYHEIVYQCFGPDIERTGYDNAARNDPESIYKLQSWWYSANRQLREFVKAHDDANEDNKYMHSEDYESYRSYTIPVGMGTKPDEIPTILSTLNAF